MWLPGCCLVRHMDAERDRSEKRVCVLAVLGCLREMDAFQDGQDAAETDDGMMLKLLCLWQPRLQWRVLHRRRQSEGCWGWRWGGAGAGDSLSHTRMPQLQLHDGANLCRPGRQRGGGELKVSLRFTQTANPIVTSSVEKMHNILSSRDSYEPNTIDYLALPSYYDTSFVGALQLAKIFFAFPIDAMLGCF